MLTAQMATTFVIALNFIAMKCDTFQLIWLYFGIVFGGVFLIWTAKRFVHQQCQDIIEKPRHLSQFEERFNVEIKVLDSQKIKAFVFQNRIYVTMGLLERLDNDELNAVLAHEVYHVRNSPNKLLSSILALTSLTFKRHNDDTQADEFAARKMGRKSLISAFRKLEIIDSEKRIKKLAA
jgi:heat shock protein HtpX